VKRTILSAILLLVGPLAHATEPAVRSRDAAHWVKYYARIYEVPVELVEAVIEVESGWNPLAVSSKGAVGLMQLMPGTAVRFGVWNRFHVQDNIRGGVAYLAWLIRVFRGDLRLVTAAYYVGESSIRSRGLAYSSPEMYRYVSRVAELYRSKRLESAVRQSNTTGSLP
jgi:soluble lytic murein transglycosylase-like protein